MITPRTRLLPLAVVALLGSTLSGCGAEPEAREAAQESADVDTTSLIGDRERKVDSSR